MTHVWKQKSKELATRSSGTPALIGNLHPSALHLPLSPLRILLPDQMLSTYTVQPWKPLPRLVSFCFSVRSSFFLCHQSWHQLLSLPYHTTCASHVFGNPVNSSLFFFPWYQLLTADGVGGSAARKSHHVYYCQTELFKEGSVPRGWSRSSQLSTDLEIKITLITRVSTWRVLVGWSLKKADFHGFEWLFPICQRIRGDPLIWQCFKGPGMLYIPGPWPQLMDDMGVSLWSSMGTASEQIECSVYDRFIMISYYIYKLWRAALDHVSIYLKSRLQDSFCCRLWFSAWRRRYISWEGRLYIWMTNVQVGIWQDHSILQIIDIFGSIEIVIYLIIKRFSKLGRYWKSYRKRIYCFFFF